MIECSQGQFEYHFYGIKRFLFKPDSCDTELDNLYSTEQIPCVLISVVSDLLVRNLKNLFYRTCHPLLFFSSLKNKDSLSKFYRETEKFACEKKKVTKIYEKCVRFCAWLCKWKVGESI